MRISMLGRTSILSVVALGLLPLPSGWALAEEAPTPTEAEVRKLVADAASVDREDFQLWIASESEPGMQEKLAGVLTENCPLTMAFLAVQPRVVLEHVRKRDFEFGPNVAQALLSIDQRHEQGGRLVAAAARPSLVTPAWITECSVIRFGAEARGTVRFEVPRQFRGRFDYVARLTGNEWVISQFDIPNWRITLRRVGPDWKIDRAAVRGFGTRVVFGSEPALVPAIDETALPLAVHIWMRGAGEIRLRGQSFLLANKDGPAAFAALLAETLQRGSAEGGDARPPLVVHDDPLAPWTDMYRLLNTLIVQKVPVGALYFSVIDWESGIEGTIPLGSAALAPSKLREPAGERVQLSLHRKPAAGGRAPFTRIRVRDSEVSVDLPPLQSGAEEAYIDTLRPPVAALTAALEAVVARSTAAKEVVADILIVPPREEGLTGDEVRVGDVLLVASAFKAACAAVGKDAHALVSGPPPPLDRSR